MKLIGKRLHVRQIEPLKQSAGGIMLPQSLMDDRQQFRVLGIGSKVEEIVPGDAVLTNTYRQNEAELPDGTMIIGLDQVVAIIRKEVRLEAQPELP